MEQAEERVRRRIRESGRITFAELMQIALFGPGGYYSHGRPIGPGGDYYTSPIVHPAFGALIALQVEQMWRLLGRPPFFTIVEGGAGDGTLAGDVLDYAKHLDQSFHRALSYVALDACPRPASGSVQDVQWVRTAGFPLGGVTGCILSNELIDSLPVHRIRRRNGRIEEQYLGLQEGAYTETWDEPSTAAIAQRLLDDNAQLEEGWEGEVALRAASWIEQAAWGLERGYAITVDYGDPIDRLYTSQRSRGTVMSYYRHTAQSDPYTRIGRQDITAHANFTTLINSGLRHGLHPVALMTQAEFLRNLGINMMTGRLLAQGEARPSRDLAGLNDLVRPDGLGKFRVLIQAKGASPAPLACLGHEEGYLADLVARLPTLPLPRASPRHIDLLAGRFPPSGPAWTTGSWDELLH